MGYAIGSGPYAVWIQGRGCCFGLSTGLWGYARTQEGGAGISC